jgi:hypothetical protein
MYWVKQLIRDPIHATMVSDSGFVTPFHAARGFMEIIAGKSREAKILAERGVIGPVDPTADFHDFYKNLGSEAPKGKGWVQKALNKVASVHEASDSATRVEIFKNAEKKALSQGMSKEDAVNYAVHKARESINFSVHGNSQFLNSLRHMVPFLSAQITSLDTVFRAATGHNLPPAEAAKARQLFLQKAAVMSMACGAYAMLMQNNEDYKKLPDNVKDNNFLMPNPLGSGHSFIKVPIPFEVGFLFKIIPETSVRYATGTSTGQETIKSFGEGVMNNLPANGIPIPQISRPILETITNHSFFTGRPVESVGDLNLPVAERGRNASEVAKMLSKNGLDRLNLSPSKIDNIIQGYTAELGTFSTDVASQMLTAAEGKSPMAKNIEEQPFMKSFMTNPNSSKAVSDFYDLDHNAQQMTTYFNALKSQGKAQEVIEMMKDPDKRALISADPTFRKVQQDMTKIRKQINFVRDNQSIAPDDRRAQVNDLERLLDKIASQGYLIAKSVGMNR